MLWLFLVRKCIPNEWLKQPLYIPPRYVDVMSVSHLVQSGCLHIICVMSFITVLFNVIQDRICSIKNQSLWSVILKSQLIDWVVCFSMFSLYSALNVIVWFAVLNDQSLHSFYTLPSSAIDVWTFTVNASKTQTHEVLVSLSMLLFVFHSRQQLVLAC